MSCNQESRSDLQIRKRSLHEINSVDSSNAINLFHLVWTTSSSFFQSWRLFVILAIQKNYRDQNYAVNIYSNTLNAQILSTCADFDKVNMTNIRFLPINEEIFKSTALEKWWFQHTEFHGDLPLTKTDFRYSHLTDLIRFAVLWKFGGIYLDFDMILLRPVTVFFNSFASQKDMQDKNTMDDSDPYNFAIAVFQPQHPFLSEVMQNASSVYDPQLWPCVGPRLITSAVHNWTTRGLVTFHTEIPKVEISRKSTTIHIFPHIYFYPLYWKFGNTLVQKTPTSRVEFGRLMAHAVTVHIWSRSTNMSTIEKGSVLNILMSHIKDGSIHSHRGNRALIK